MKHLYVIPLALLALSLAGAVWAYQAYHIQMDTTGGLDQSASGDFILQGTLGQIAPGHSSETGFTLDAGFWTPGAAARPPAGPRRIYLPIVIRNYPLIVDLLDVPGRCDNSYTIAAGTSYRENFGASNDNDWYQFTADAGITYTIRTSSLGARADTVMGLYAPDCATLLVENDDSGEPNDKGSLIIWSAPTTGFYHLLVRNYDWRIYGSDTSYTLLLAQSTFNVQRSTSNVQSKPAPPPTPMPESH